MSNVAIDLTKTVKEIITTMKTAIDNLNSDVATNKTAIDNLNSDVATNKTAIDNLKTQIMEAVYPVGSVYVSITDSRNPADILGFGTWEALPAGYGLVAQGTATAEDGSTLTFTAGQKSGEFKHQITIRELPKIIGGLQFRLMGDGGNIVDVVNNSPNCFKYERTAGNKWVNGIGYGKDNNQPIDVVRLEFGNNQCHNNISPGIAVYGWYRIS